METSLEDINNNLSLLNIPIYYKYRYTFNTKEENNISDYTIKTDQLVRFIKDKYLCGDKLTSGVEIYTKGMLSCKPHVHIHFMSRHKSDTIRKGIARRFEMIGRCQACIPEVIVEADGAKFWRYPLKQQKEESKMYHKCLGFAQVEIDNMIHIAYESWKCSAQIMVNKLEKKLERTSKERLYVYFDSLPFVYESIKQTCCLAYMYYAENENEVSVKTIDGYVNQYLLINKHLSPETFYDNTH